MDNTNEVLPSFLRRKNDSILFNGDGTFYFYMPEKFFETKIAYYNGDYISTLGILSYAIKDKTGKMSALKTFSLPTRFDTKPFEMEKIKQVKLIKESQPLDYRILSYKKDDVIIADVNVPEEVSNVEQLISLFIINGFIPNTIDYNKIQDYFIDAFNYNNIGFGFSLQLFGILISELCRSTSDINKPFRLSKTNNQKDYKSISIKMVPRLVSAYTALNSEVIDEALVFASLNDNKVKIPLERVLTGEGI